jgi:hypothetical protein
MSYLGKVDMNDANIKHYSLTGSTLTVIPIGWTPASEQSLRVTINGVVQQGDTFSYSGSNLTLGGPLVVTDTLEVVGIQSVGNIITPADNSVTTTKLADDAVTLAKMAGGTDGNLITYDASGDPAYVATGSATNVLTSNGAGAAPTFQAAAGEDNAPSFAAYAASTGLSNATYNKITAGTEIYDVGGCHDTSTGKFTVPAGEGGKYAVWTRATVSNTGGVVVQNMGQWMYLNGVANQKNYHGAPANSTSAMTQTFFSVFDLVAADEIEWYIWITFSSGTMTLDAGIAYNSWGTFKLAGV